MIRIIARPLLGLPSYHVVTGEQPEDEPLLVRAALRLGDELSKTYYGSKGGYVVLFNAGAGRRKPWPHAHVTAVRSVGHKRLVLALLLLKRWLPSRPARHGAGHPRRPRAGRRVAKRSSPECPTRAVRAPARASRTSVRDGDHRLQ